MVQAVPMLKQEVRATSWSTESGRSQEKTEEEPGTTVEWGRGGSSVPGSLHCDWCHSTSRTLFLGSKVALLETLVCGMQILSLWGNRFGVGRL